jgi:hypothetical protein
MHDSYNPAAQPSDDKNTSTPQEQQPNAIDALDQAMAAIARRTGVTMHSTLIDY